MTEALAFRTGVPAADAGAATANAAAIPTTAAVDVSLEIICSSVVINSHSGMARQDNYRRPSGHRRRGLPTMIPGRCGPILVLDIQKLRLTDGHAIAVRDSFVTHNEVVRVLAPPCQDHLPILFGQFDQRREVVDVDDGLT